MAMITGVYRFTRLPNSVPGFFSKNRASTDALNVLSRWRSMGAQRDFDIHVDKEDEFVAALSFLDIDQNSARDDLDALCKEHGVERAPAASLG
jgi:hypothetical protein